MEVSTQTINCICKLNFKKMFIITFYIFQPLKIMFKDNDGTDSHFVITKDTATNILS